MKPQYKWETKRVWNIDKRRYETVKVRKLRKHIYGAWRNKSTTFYCSVCKLYGRCKSALHARKKLREHFAKTGHREFIYCNFVYMGNRNLWWPVGTKKPNWL